MGALISNRYQSLVPRLVGAGMLALSLATACGARTSLKTKDPCQNEGETRECQAACGAGTQVCEAGYWRPCVVPVTERPCENQCGAGMESCIEGVWQACQVPVTSRSCDNDCGSGIQTCSDDSWGTCQVEPVTQSCSNSCGLGERVCQNNKWGGCQVEPVVAPCEDECGSGQQVCQNDAWGECEVEPVPRTCSTACGDGNEWCKNGRWGACDAPQPRPPKLKTTVRDFLDTHPDFEGDFGSVNYGAVEEMLGPDDKPVRTPQGTSITSDESFYSWYRDVEGINLATEKDLQLVESTAGNALFEYRDNSFFPIDDELFGNQGRIHNYHFTLEAVTEFRYVGGEIFTFIGDDDIWVFINRRLAIDIGGLHVSLEGTVELDSIADEFGLEVGEVYPLHIFFAERHTVASNFTIETSIAGPPECD